MTFARCSARAWPPSWAAWTALPTMLSLSDQKVGNAPSRTSSDDSTESRRGRSSSRRGCLRARCVPGSPRVISAASIAVSMRSGAYRSLSPPASSLRTSAPAPTPRFASRPPECSSASSNAHQVPSTSRRLHGVDPDPASRSTPVACPRRDDGPVGDPRHNHGAHPPRPRHGAPRAAATPRPPRGRGPACHHPHADGRLPGRTHRNAGSAEVPAPSRSRSRPDAVRARGPPPRAHPRCPGVPTPQFDVRVEGFEVDLLFREHRVIVEADGARFHDTPTARAQDREKQAVLEAAGYRVIRVTWSDVVDHPSRTLRRLLRALA